MSKPEFSKPFNISDTKVGAPYCCRDGQQAEILKWDCNHKCFPLIGVVCENTYHYPESWTISGEQASDEELERRPGRDLVMLPIGMCQSKPVFMGDELVTRVGVNFVVEAKHIGDLDEENTWPVPELDYPTTQMKLEDFDAALSKSGSHECISARAACAIANAALRHAIDAGQVVLPSAAVSDDLLMKVAKAVMIEMRGLGGMAVYGFNENNCKSIIASVTSAKDAQLIDFSIKKGDIVYKKTWGAGSEPLEVVDINWALKAVAVKLSPTGGTVVLPVEGMSKEQLSKDKKEDAK